MTGVVVEPATSERWSDLLAIFEGDGPKGCWCQYWRQSSGDYSRGEPGSGERNLQAQAAEAPPAPGLIAYVDGEAAGWCGFGPRSSFERLVRSRTIPVVDDVPVWSVVCFKVRVGFRRRGIMHALLAGAIEYARHHGAPILEAYPIDPDGGRLDVGFSYVGFTGVFEAAGFTRILETSAQSARRPRWLMRLDLRD